MSHHPNMLHSINFHIFLRSFQDQQRNTISIDEVLKRFTKLDTRSPMTNLLIKNYETTDHSSAFSLRQLAAAKGLFNKNPSKNPAETTQHVSSFDYTRRHGGKPLRSI